MDGGPRHFNTPAEEDAYIQKLRGAEYPQLKDTCYLDHAGTALYPKSLIEHFSSDLTSTLYGNPHSAAPSSIQTTRAVEDIRHDALRFFHADPNHFDLVFVANATAGIKLVMDSFRDTETGFWYGHHYESHTSLVGLREAAQLGSRCMESDSEAEQWIQQYAHADAPQLELFAYPAQSNMNGRRLPLRWCRDIRAKNVESDRHTRYSLLDAAALVSTSPLDLSDPDCAPDFTVLSFYKIFGFPDLGALIVRKASADILCKRRYFGGGTVDMVVCLKEKWHVSKSTSIHAVLEDGTLPFHNIMALKHAFRINQQIYGSMSHVSRRLARLAENLYHGLSSMKHSNGRPVCKIYCNKEDPFAYEGANLQGPTLAFNMRNSQGAWISITEVDKLASIKNIHLRTGGLCNPGGIASWLDLTPWQMRENFSGGHRCGGDEDIRAGKPTGAIRVSLGASSIQKDVDVLLNFVEEFFVEKSMPTMPDEPEIPLDSVSQGDFYVESLTVYPIKSCAGWSIPSGQNWEVHQEGLAWDREWCLIHQSTGVALTQKRHPKMALIRPSIDLEKGMLRVQFAGWSLDTSDSNKAQEVTVPLSADPTYLEDIQKGFCRDQKSTVFGDQITARAYTCTRINSFFSEALGVPCQLARFPASPQSGRHAKAHLQSQKTRPLAPPPPPQESLVVAGGPSVGVPLLLSNESPILVISRSSLNRLNEQIKERGGKAARAEVFRANIVVAQHLSLALGGEQPYVEDHWRLMRVGAQHQHQQQFFQLLGPCRRCQMVCVDQRTGEKNAEPFVTLAKTRRQNGKVWFGQHSSHLGVLGRASCAAAQNPTIRVGDAVQAFAPGAEADLIINQAHQSQLE